MFPTQPSGSDSSYFSSFNLPELPGFLEPAQFSSSPTVDSLDLVPLPVLTPITQPTPIAKPPVDVQQVKLNNSFIAAISSGHFETAKKLLAEGANVDTVNENNLTALHFAVIQEDLDLIKFILSYNPQTSFNQKNGWGFVPIDCATNEEIRQMLLDHQKTHNLVIHSHGIAPRTPEVQELIDSQFRLSCTSKNPQDLMRAIRNTPRFLTSVGDGLLGIELAAEQRDYDRVSLLRSIHGIRNKKPFFASGLYTKAVNNSNYQTTQTIQTLVSNGFLDLTEIKSALTLAFNLGSNTNIIRALIYSYHEGVKLASGSTESNSMQGCKEIVYLAISSNKPEAVQIFFIMKYDFSHDSSLHVAAIHGHKEMVQLLLRLDADPKHKNEHGATAADVASTDEIKQIILSHTRVSNPVLNKQFIEAFSSGKLETAKKLLAKGADIDTFNEDGQTALHFAVIQDDGALIDYILGFKPKTSFSQKNRWGRTPIDFTCDESIRWKIRNHQTKHNIALFESSYRFITSSDQQKIDEEFSLLCYEGNAQKIVQFLFKGTDTFIKPRFFICNNIIREGGRLPIEVAAAQNHLEVVNLLRRIHGIRSEKPFLSKGMLNKAVAARESNIGTLRALIFSGFVHLDELESAITDAVGLDRPTEMVKLLLDAYLNNMTVSKNIQSFVKIVWEAVKKGNSSVVKLFLDKGYNVSQDSSLHIAASHGHKNLTKLLLEHNADPNFKNRSGKTAAELASTVEIRQLILSHIQASKPASNPELNKRFIDEIASGNVDAAVQLLAEGADIDTVNEDGQTALHFAIVQEDNPLIAYLLNLNPQTSFTQVNNWGLTPIDFCSDENVRATIINHQKRHNVAVGAYGQRPNSQFNQNIHDNEFIRLCHSGQLDLLKKHIVTRPRFLFALPGRHTVGIEIAAHYNHHEMVKFLRTVHGIRRNRPYSAGDLLSKTVNTGSLYVLKTLIFSGFVEPNEIRAAIQLAVTLDRPAEMVQILLDAFMSNPTSAKLIQSFLDIVWEAVKKGNTSVVKLFLDKGYNVSYDSSLHIAASFGHGDVTRLLLEHNADPSYKNRNGKTAADLAATKEIQQLILNFSSRQAAQAVGTPPVASESNNDNARLYEELVQLCESGTNPERVKELYSNIRIHIVPKHPKYGYLRPLHIAAQCNRDNIVNAILDLNPALINQPCASEEEMSPIHVAAKHGALTAVKVLAERGANLNATDMYSRTPLYLACENNKSRTVQFLLSQFVNRGIKASNGKTALNVAKDDQCYKAFFYHYPKPAQDTPQTNQDYYDELVRLCESGTDPERVKELYSNLENINNQTHPKYGILSPLHIAAQYNSDNIVNAILDLHPTLVDQVSGGGKTPLHVATVYGALNVVKALKARGANLNATDAESRTPLYLASYNNRRHTVQYLLSHFVDREIKASNGLTALDVAKDDVCRQAFYDHYEGAAPVETPNAPSMPSNSTEPVDQVNNYPSVPNVQVMFKDPLLKQTALKMYESLLKHYTAKHSQALIDHFANTRGKWAIDFANHLPGNISKAEWLAPIKALDVVHNSDKEQKCWYMNCQVALLLMRFFDSSLNPSQIPASNTIDIMLAKQTQKLNALTDTHIPLSEFLSKELAPTFLWLKMARIKFLLTHPESLKTTGLLPTKPFPCFVLAQDANKIRVFLTQVQLSLVGEVMHVSRDADHKALQYFVENFVPRENIKISDEYVTIDYADSAKIVPQNGVIVLERQSSVNIFDEDKKTSSSERSRKRAERAKEKHARKRSKKRHRDSSAPDRTPFTFNDLFEDNNSPSHRSKRTRPKESRKHSSKRKGVSEYQEPVFNRHYLPLSELTPQQNPLLRKPVAGSSDGSLPNITNGDHIAFEEMPNEEITNDNFFAAIGRQSLRKVQRDVSIQAQKAVVIHSDIQPMRYSIEESLKQVGAPSEFFHFNRRLKPYQVSAASDLHASSSHGLSTILSLDMGMGKTMTFVEYLIQLIAKRAEPQVHLVAAPVSLVTQHHDDLPEDFIESSIVAWQLSGRNAPPALYNEFFNAYLESRHDNKALIGFLRILHYYADPFDKVWTKFTQIFNDPQLQVRVEEVLKAHLEKIEKLINVTPESASDYHKSLEKICMEFGIYSSLDQTAVILDLFKTPHREKEFHKLCCFVGQLLNLHPERQPLPETLPQFEESALQSLRKIGFTPTQVKKMFSLKLPGENEVLDRHKIVILTLDDLFKDLGLKKNGKGASTSSARHHPIGSLIVDEANVAQTASSITAQSLEKAITALGVRSDTFGKNNVLLVTGTPFSNNLRELWTLIGLANGRSTKDSTTFNSLQTLNKEVCKKLVELTVASGTSENPEIRNMVMKSFAHSAGFRGLIRKLICSRKKTDEDVIEQWYGRIPTRIDHTVPFYLPQEMLDHLNEVRESDFTKKISFMNAYRARAKALIHPSLVGRDLKSEAKENYPFLNIFRKATGATPTQIEDWINQSITLRAFFADENIQRTINEHERTLIFTEYRVQAKMLEKAIRFRTGKRVNIYDYHGGLKREERPPLVSDFQYLNNQKPSFMTTMVKCGGVGLNIPETQNIIFLTLPWNPAVENQGADRAIRVNNLGEKHVIRYVYPGLKISEHTQIIQQKKRALENFLFGKVNTNRELFKMWLHVLESLTLYSLFDDDTSAAETLAKNQIIVDYLNKLDADITEETLSSALTAAGAPVFAMTPAPAAARVGKPVGFENASANCGFNALLQMIEVVPSLKQAYIEFAERRTRSSTDAGLQLEIPHRRALLGALEAYQTNLRSGIAIDKAVSQNVRVALAYFIPNDVISSDATRQEDVTEILMAILGNVNSANNSLFTPMETERTSWLFVEEAPLVQIDQVSTILLSQESGQTFSFSQMFENFWLQTTEHVTEKRQYVTAPAEFLVKLQMFSDSRSFFVKKRDRVDVPMRLKLPEGVVKDSTTPFEYELTSFIVHEDASVASGHYYTFKKVEGIWWKCDDKTVTQFRKGEVEQLLSEGPENWITSYLHHYSRV